MAIFLYCCCLANCILFFCCVFSWMWFFFHFVVIFICVILSIITEFSFLFVFSAVLYIFTLYIFCLKMKTKKHSFYHCLVCLMCAGSFDKFRKKKILSYSLSLFKTNNNHYNHHYHIAQKNTKCLFCIVLFCNTYYNIFTLVIVV